MRVTQEQRSLLFVAAASWVAVLIGWCARIWERPGILALIFLLMVGCGLFVLLRAFVFPEASPPGEKQLTWVAVFVVAGAMSAASGSPSGAVPALAFLICAVSCLLRGLAELSVSRHRSGETTENPQRPPSTLHTPPTAAPLVGFNEEHRCTRCQYDLRGLTEPRCPECGLPFDPTFPDITERSRIRIQTVKRWCSFAWLFVGVEVAVVCLRAPDLPPPGFFFVAAMVSSVVAIVAWASIGRRARRSAGRSLFLAGCAAAAIPTMVIVWIVAGICVLMFGPPLIPWL